MTSSSKLDYSERLIAFVDVLGFGSLVRESGQGGADAAAKVERIARAILWARQELEEHLGPPSSFVFTQFSDSFVVSIGASTPQERLDAYSFLIALGEIIDCFLGSQLILRGGISRGKLIHDERLLFGPAMNRAYELEHRIAVVPRIIFDPLLPELRESAIPSLITEDSDGLFYVDYFNPRKSFYLVPTWKYAVQQVIEAMPNTAELSAKREWLVARFNASLDGFSVEDFKERLDDYVNDADANNAVCEDYEELLEPARRLKFQRTEKAEVLNDPQADESF